MKRITATVRYIQINMGFWALDANGQKYEVLNMPPQLQQDGKKTRVWIQEKKGMASIHMYGTPAIILGFET